MGKFNWWRRHKKKALLQKKDAYKGKSFLLQQIENGDYDPSDYLRQAYLEKEYCKKEQDRIRKSWVAGANSLQYKLDEVERKYIKRFNKLMEDYNAEEIRLLQQLKERLILEFEVDCWEEALKIDYEQDLTQFYHNYKKIANKSKADYEAARSKKAPDSKLP